MFFKPYLTASSGTDKVQAFFLLAFGDLGFKRPSLLFLFVALMLLSGHGFYYHHPSSSWSIDVPEGFSVHPDKEHASITAFYGPKQKMVVQIFEINKDEVESVEALVQHFSKRLELTGSYTMRREGEYSYALFLGKTIKDLGARFGKQVYRVYMAGYYGKDKSFIVLGKIPEMQLDIDSRARYEIESALESFSPHAKALYRPGVISIISRGAKATSAQAMEVAFGPYRIPAGFDLHEAKEIEDAIVRETFVLLTYQGKDRSSVWKRFYRMIYRAAYEKLRPFAEQLKKILKANEIDKQGALALIYNVLYHKSSNELNHNLVILNPLDLLLFGKGDCDSKTLTAHLLADHLEISTSIMFALNSAKQPGHAALGVPKALFPDSKKPVFKPPGRQGPLLYFEMLKDPHPRVFENPSNWQAFAARYPR